MSGQDFMTKVNIKYMVVIWISSSVYINTQMFDSPEPLRKEQAISPKILGWQGTALQPLVFGRRNIFPFSQQLSCCYFSSSFLGGCPVSPFLKCCLFPQRQWRQEVYFRFLRFLDAFTWTFFIWPLFFSASSPLALDRQVEDILILHGNSPFYILFFVAIHKGHKKTLVPWGMGTSRIKLQRRSKFGSQWGMPYSRIPPQPASLICCLSVWGFAAGYHPSGMLGFRPPT